jgi:hypothetical protein
MPAKVARVNEEPAEEVLRVIPVLNNRLGTISISAGSGTKGAFDGGKLIKLNVGTNLVPEKRWLEAMKQTAVKTLLRTKIVGTGSPEDSLARIGKLTLVVGNPLRADNPLLDLEDEDALKFVENTESLDLLEMLATQETTGQVLIAINAKIKKIKSPKNKPRQKTAEEEG